MWPNPQEIADLATFNEENLFFLCSETLTAHVNIDVFE